MNELSLALVERGWEFDGTLVWFGNAVSYCQIMVMMRIRVQVKE